MFEIVLQFRLGLLFTIAARNNYSNHNLRSAALIGKPLDGGFSPSCLPTNKDVLRKFFYYFKIKKFAEQKSINHTVTVLIDIWKKVSGAAVPGCSYFQSAKSRKEKI